MLDRLLKLDRRWIFLCIAVATALPLIFPFSLVRVEVTDPTRGIFDTIDTLPAGSVILFSNDYDPGSAAELRPMTLAILRHAFHRKQRVVVMTLWPGGLALTQDILQQMTVEFPHLRKNEDWAFLGYNAGQQAAIANMVRNLTETYPKDRDGMDTASLPILVKADGRKIESLKDFAYVVSISAGDPGLEQWVIYGQGESGCLLGGGSTAVSITQYLSYFQAKQMNGLLGGLRGGAEYERLLKDKYGTEVKNAEGKGSVGVQVLSVDHFLIIAFILFSNVIYFASKLRTAASTGAER
ncbi:MAG: hypothetical protein HYY93_01140 [Planctomycetes bacterium]|nr:hypothetical protein [Planctomycetota bacterium]